MAATAESIGVAPFELDEAQADTGDSEDDLARFIAGHDDFTQAERVLARIVLHRHGLALGS